MTAETEVVAALEKALEAGPTPGPWSWWTSRSFRRLSSDATGKDGDVLYGAVQKSDNHGDIQATQATMDFIAAVNPLAIRTLLDAHASALRDAARYRWLEQRFLGADFRWGADEESGNEGCQALVFTWPGGPVWSDLTMTIDHCAAALDDNTKGAAE